MGDKGTTGNPRRRMTLVESRRRSIDWIFGPGYVVDRLRNFECPECSLRSEHCAKWQYSSMALSIFPTRTNCRKASSAFGSIMARLRIASEIFAGAEALSKKLAKK